MAQSSTLFKRLALAAVGQALPEASALSASVKVAQKGLLATVVAGILFAALIIIALFGFYLYMVAAGVTQLMAVGIIAVILLMLTVISALIAERQLAKLPKAKEELLPFRNGGGLDLPVKEMISAFVDGLAAGGATHPRYHAGDIQPEDLKARVGDHAVPAGEARSRDYAQRHFAAQATGHSSRRGGEKRAG